MAVQFDLKAELRNDKGKGASRRLRREGRLPAIVYGGDKDPVSLTLDHDEIKHSMEEEAFFSSVLTLDIAGKKEPVILRDLQRHPYKPLLTHVDFQRIDENREMHLAVPLHFEGEEKSEGVKKGGVFSRLMTELDVACLPRDLPSYIEVDVSGLDIGGSIHLSEVELPEGVHIPALAGLEEMSEEEAHEHDAAVCTVVSTRAVTEAEEAEEAGEAEEGAGEE